MHYTTNRNFELIYRLYIIIVKYCNNYIVQFVVPFCEGGRSRDSFLPFVGSLGTSRYSSLCSACRWHVWDRSREGEALLGERTPEGWHRWPEWVMWQLCISMTTVTMDYMIPFPIGYVNLFKPVIQSVMEHYRPTCIVLQVTYHTTFKSQADSRRREWHHNSPTLSSTSVAPIPSAVTDWAVSTSVSKDTGQPRSPCTLYWSVFFSVLWYLKCSVIPRFFLSWMKKQGMKGHCSRYLLFSPCIGNWVENCIPSLWSLLYSGCVRFAFLWSLIFPCIGSVWSLCGVSMFPRWC